MLRSIRTVLVFVLSVPVHLYRYTLSPFMGKWCRHYPTCSQYMLDSLKKYGPVTGLLMGINRILRCRPGGTHGYDPVPLMRFKKYRPLNSWLRKWKFENRLKR